MTRGWHAGSSIRTTDSRPAIRFQDRHHQRGACIARAVRREWLAASHQRCILQKPLPSVWSRCERCGCHLRKRRVSTILGWVARDWNERSAERLKKGVAFEPAGYGMFGDLARAARHDVLMALAAALRVVSRAEAVRIRLYFLEDESVVIEGTQRHDRVLIDLLEPAAPVRGNVGEVMAATKTAAMRDAGKELGRISWCLLVDNGCFGL